MESSTVGRLFLEVLIQFNNLAFFLILDLSRVVAALLIIATEDKKIKSNNFTGSNRDKFSIYIVMFEKWAI